MSSINSLHNSAIHLQQRVNASNKTTKVRRVFRSDHTNSAQFKFLDRLQERPRLIAEISTTNSQFSVAQVAQSLLKAVNNEAVLIQSYVETGNFDLHTLNEVDKSKHRIKALMNTKLEGQYVLDSSFVPMLSDTHYIGFTIDGLDNKRLPLNDEVVTLFVANKMLPLVFSRLDSSTERLKKLNRMLYLSKMNIQLLASGQFEFFMLDTDWRTWDLNAQISGQGSRFPSDSVLEIPVKSTYPTFDALLGLDLKQPNVKETLTNILERIKSVYIDINQDIQQLDLKAGQLIPLCAISSPQMSENIRIEMQSKSKNVLRDLNKHYIGITPENISALLEQ